MSQGPKQRGVTYRGINVALEASPDSAEAGRFVGSCVVLDGGRLVKMEATIETFATEDAALRAIEGSVPSIVDELIRIGEVKPSQRQ